MSDSDLLSLAFGDTGRRAPGSDEITRRVARLCAFIPGTKILALGLSSGPAARLLATEYGCVLTVSGLDAKGRELLSAAVKKDGSGERVSFADGPLRELPQTFQAIIGDDGLALPGVPLQDRVSALRELLLPKGKLAFQMRARVGRSTPEKVTAFYQDRQEELLLPREALMSLERGGFEPLAAEAIADALVDEHYAAVEAALPGVSDLGAAARLRREVELYRREGGRAALSTVLIVGRRKEPGEKPPAARGGE